VTSKLYLSASGTIAPESAEPHGKLPLHWENYDSDVSGNEITTSSLSFCMRGSLAPRVDFLLKLFLIFFVRARAKYKQPLSQTLLPNCDA